MDAVTKPKTKPEAGDRTRATTVFLDADGERLFRVIYYPTTAYDRRNSDKFLLDRIEMEVWAEDSDGNHYWMVTGGVPPALMLRARAVEPHAAGESAL